MLIKKKKAIYIYSYVLYMFIQNIFKATICGFLFRIIFRDQ